MLVNNKFKKKSPFNQCLIYSVVIISRFSDFISFFSASKFIELIYISIVQLIKTFLGRINYTVCKFRIFSIYNTNRRY